jgi:hypothetical protein
MKRHRPLVPVVMPTILSAGLIVAVPARAQTLDDKVWIQGSAYRPDVSTEISAASVAHPAVATTIDLESDLDLADRETVPAVYAGWRINRHFQIAAEYYSLDRAGAATLAHDITFADVTYPAAATIASKFNTDIYRLTIGYVFMRRKTFEFGGALGFHVTDFDVSLSGQGSIGGATAATEIRRKTVLAPLPTLGLFGTFEPVRRLTLGGRVDYLQLKLGDYKGRLINTQATISYRVIKHVGIGLMYRYVDYHLDVSKPNWLGDVGYKFHGPAAFLEIGF